MGASGQAVAIHAVDPQDRARADFYALVARLFYGPPDAALLEALAGGGELAGEPGGVPEAWSCLRRAAARAVPETLRGEYDDTFIGVGKPEVMLYGSYYMAGFLHEKPLAHLRSHLAAHRFARRAGADEPEDHIAGLADVMRQLIVDEACAPAERDAAQREFFTRYIEPWYGAFCAAVEAAPGTDFYRNAARFARAFLDVEKEAFRIT